MKKVITLVAAILMLAGNANSQVVLGSYGWEEGQSFDLYAPTGAGYTYTVKSDAAGAKSGSGYAECAVSALPANMWDLQVVPGGLIVEAAKPYRFEIWAKATGVAPVVNFTCGTYAYSDVPGISKYGVAVGTEWTRINLMIWLTADQVAAIPLNNGVAGQIRFPMHIGNAVGTYYFDDFSFTQTALAYGIVKDNKVTLNFGWEIGLTADAINAAAFGVKSGANAVDITGASLVDIGTADAPMNVVELTLARNIAAGEVISVSCNGQTSNIEYSGTISPLSENFMVLDFNETIKNMSTGGTGFNQVSYESLKFTSDNSTLKINEGNAEFIKVFNLAGKCVAESALRNDVSVSELSKGVYVVKAFLNGTIQTAKFIK